MSNLIVGNFCEGCVVLMYVKLETKGDKKRTLQETFS